MSAIRQISPLLERLIVISTGDLSFSMGTSFVWQPPLNPRDGGRWIEPLQVYTQHYALYMANLIHQDTRSVIKVVRYGLNIQCYPGVQQAADAEQFELGFE